MVTPVLERLIWLGEAKLRAVTLGGCQKHRLKVPDDRFIVILKMTHFPYIPDEEDVLDNLDPRRVTQMTVGSQKSFSSFVFRNDIGVDIGIGGGGALQNFLRTGQPTYIDTYLLHEEDVSFSFSLGRDLGTTLSAGTPTKAPAFVTPLDYGKIGLPSAIGALPVSLLRSYGLGTSAELRPMGDLTPASEPNVFDTLQFPVISGITAYTDDDIQGFKAYPIVQVQYVECKGNPTKLMSNN